MLDGNEERALASACGHFSGLCPRFESEAPSRPPGCHLGETRSRGGVYRCVTKRGRRTCAECAESPCPRLLRALKAEEGLDGFTTQRPPIIPRAFERWVLMPLLPKRQSVAFSPRSFSQAGTTAAR